MFSGFSDSVYHGSPGVLQYVRAAFSAAHHRVTYCLRLRLFPKTTEVTERDETGWKNRITNRKVAALHKCRCFSGVVDLCVLWTANGWIWFGYYKPVAFCLERATHALSAFIWPSWMEALPTIVTPPVSHCSVVIIFFFFSSSCLLACIQ